MKSWTKAIVPVLLVLAVVGAVVLYLRWRREIEANAVLVFKVAAQDSVIGKQTAAIDDYATETARLRAAPARIIHDQVPVPVFTPSKPDTVDVTDTAAVRVALDQHRAREDSLARQLVERARRDSVDLAEMFAAFQAEQRLRQMTDTLVRSLTVRVALADSLAKNYRPRWYDSIVIAVGYTARGRQADALIGVKLPWP